MNPTQVVGFNGSYSVSSGLGPAYIGLGVLAALIFLYLGTRDHQGSV